MTRRSPGSSTVACTRLICVKTYFQHALCGLATQCGDNLCRRSSKGDQFPTCQVRVVRFYVSCLVLLLLLSSPPPLVVLLLSLSSSSSCSTATRDPQCSLSDLNHDHPHPVFPAGPQPRPSTPSVPCRTSTTTIHAQCSLPDLNHDHPRPVFPAGPQPRPSTPSVPCRTSTASIPAQCSLPDLNREYPRQKICHIECQKICQIEC